MESDPTALVKQSERRYHAQLERVAHELLEGHGQCKVLLLAGPSASGKTTTAQKIAQLLEQAGIQAPVVSLDDFFVRRGLYPRTPDGHEDFESLYGLDLDRIHQDLGQLIQTGRAVFPLYDFLAGQPSEETRTIALGREDILLVEGIHALNPLISQSLPADRLGRAYVSAARGFTDDKEAVLTPEHLRLIRRLIRDKNYRGYPVYKTLSRWGSVLVGEQENILPYRERADFTIDSTMDYEPCLYRGLVDSYLGEEEQRRHEDYITLLQTGIGRFPALKQELIPADSLLWEFLRPQEAVEIPPEDAL